MDVMAGCLTDSEGKQNLDQGSPTQIDKSVRKWNAPLPYLASVQKFNFNVLSEAFLIGERKYTNIYMIMTYFEKYYIAYEINVGKKRR